MRADRLCRRDVERRRTEVAERARASGADEIVCLVDFVGDTSAVPAGLEHLDTVRRHFAPSHGS